jgi:hypothetical protein
MLIDLFKRKAQSNVKKLWAIYRAAFLLERESDHLLAEL